MLDEMLRIATNAAKEARATRGCAPDPGLTRRRFAPPRQPRATSYLPSGAALALLLLLTLACGGTDPATDTTTEPTDATATVAVEKAPGPFFDAALQVAAGLDAGSVDGVWADDAARPEGLRLNLGSGVGGKVLFFLALHEVSGDPAHLEAARRGADHLLANLPEALNPEGFPPAAGLYYGMAGVGLVLERAHQATGDARYLDGARRCLELVEGAAKDSEGEAGKLWHPSFNDLLFGNAGITLYTLSAAESLDSPEALALATEAGRLLLARGIEEQGGLTWKFRQDTDFVLPNFSHGAAGIGYLMGRLYLATGEQDFLDAALGAARYLQAIADTTSTESGFRVPYGWPEESWEGLHDVGWAHGPAGTARLFELLHQVTGDAPWRDRVLACGESALASGMPGDPAPGFGDGPFPIDRRFGMTGVADFMLDLYRLTGDGRYLEFAHRLAEHVLAQAREGEQGIYWEVPKAEGEAPARPTGLMSGAAGHGLLFLRLDAVDRGTDLGLALPDDPFTTAAAR